MLVEKPNVGDHVIITTDWSDYLKCHMSWVPRRTSVEGTVLPSEEGVDPPDTVRIMTTNVNVPISVIPYKRIITLQNKGKTIQQSRESAQEITTANYEVKGSKGDVYVISRQGEHFTCTCPGFRSRMTCKHVNTLKEELKEKGKL